MTIAEASIQRGILQRVCKLLDKQVPAHEVSSAPDELRLGTAAFRARQKPQMPWLGMKEGLGHINVKKKKKPHTTDSLDSSYLCLLPPPPPSIHWYLLLYIQAVLPMWSCREHVSVEILSSKPRRGRGPAYARPLCTLEKWGRGGGDGTQPARYKCEKSLWSSLRFHHERLLQHFNQNESYLEHRLHFFSYKSGILMEKEHPKDSCTQDFFSAAFRGVWRFIFFYCLWTLSSMLADLSKHTIRGVEA